MPSRSNDPKFTAKQAMRLFFRTPRSNHVEGWTSTLCLCRRELQLCLIGKIVLEKRMLTHEHHRLFASTMVALSGIDLLSRMVPGGQGKGAGAKFVAFVEEYSKETPIALTKEQAEAVWSFRNALSHTFGLYHVTRDGKAQRLWLYDQNDKAPVVRERDGGWEICVDSVVELFLLLVRAVESRVALDADVQLYFLDAFHRYGKIYWRGPHIA